MAPMQNENIIINNITVSSRNTYPTKVRQAMKNGIKNITVEPVIFFYAIGFGITTIITPSLYFDKINLIMAKVELSYIFNL